MKKAVLLSDAPEHIDRVYGAGRLDKLKAQVELYPHVISRENLAEHRLELCEIQVAFSTWGMPEMEGDELAALPSLEAVFYAAGSVQSFARPFLNRGITVVSAWAANGVPVAEFTLAQILLSCKGYFRNTRDCRNPDQRHLDQVFRGSGIFGETVGLIGVGMIARSLCRLLEPFNLQLIAHDPYLDDAVAVELGIEKVDLATLFARSYVVSNHLPNIPATRAMLKGALFSSMRWHATFINTGRGAQVVEEDLLDVLERRQDLTALLDVTFPEPPEKGSRFFSLPNVQLSSHIAGSLNDELVRMADYVLEEFERWQRGEKLLYSVSLDMLETMA
jgi:phosphoglycerate dehydrogenase-like enzyme